MIKEGIAVSRGYDPHENDWDREEYDDPYAHLADDMDRLLEEDAYPGRRPRNYSNGYGAYDDEIPYDPRDPARRYVEEDRRDDSGRRQPQSPNIYAYNADFEKQPRRSGSRSSANRSSGHREAERHHTKAGARQKRAASGRTRGRKRRHPILKVLLVLLVLVVIACAALWVFAKQPVSSDAIGARKDGCSVILLAGTDADGTRTDTMMLLYLDSKNGEMNLMSLPRDTYTSASWSVPKLNSVYGVNDGGKEGMEALMDYIKSCIGFRPDGYILVDMDCFADLVNLMGGVTFDVPMAMQYDDPSQDLHINLEEGEQKLNGEQAMWLVRFRSGYAMADLQRIQVQRDFIQAAMEQWTKPQKLIKYPAAAALLSANTTTDLSLRNLVWIGKAVLASRGNGMQMETLPGEAADISGGSYYVIWPETTANLINESFNPYQTPVSKDNIYSPWY